MTYEEALDYVASLVPRGWRLGLDRMQAFADRAELLEDSPARIIHVAGTNGKGSVTAYLQSILHESGYRVGAFFSPFVHDPRERMQLGRELIPKTIFAGLTAMLQPVAEEFTESEFGGITEFEFKTALALLFFKRLKCEWVALEVGLGGRLDATNIVTPACSVIVSIGLDHTNVLGETIDAIAYEKAGIIKPGVPVIVGHLPPAALAVVREEARKRDAPAWVLGEEIALSRQSDGYCVETPHGRHAGLSLGIPGALQDHNMALAVAACDAAGATRTLGGLRRGTELARIPGRFEVRRIGDKTVVLDGAHNADAAAALAESLGNYMRSESLDPEGGLALPQLGRVLLVTGMVAGHEPAAFYAPLQDRVDAAYVTPIDFHRTLPASAVAEALPALDGGVREFESAQAAVRAALADAGENDLVLITGSFYLVGEAGRALDTLSKTA